MKTLTINAQQAILAFNQAKLWGWSVKNCMDFASDELETEQDINDFEKEIVNHI